MVFTSTPLATIAGRKSSVRAIALLVVVSSVMAGCSSDRSVTQSPSGSTTSSSHTTSTVCIAVESPCSTRPFAEVVATLSRNATDSDLVAASNYVYSQFVKLVPVFNDVGIQPEYNSKKIVVSWQVRRPTSAQLSYVSELLKGYPGVAKVVTTGSG
jgi:hypothetical protein